MTKVVTRQQWLSQQLALTKVLACLAQAHAGVLEALILNEEAHKRACAARHHNLQAASQLEACGLIRIRADERIGERLANVSLHAEPYSQELRDRIVVIINTVVALADARKWGGVQPHEGLPRRMVRVPSINNDTAMQISDTQ
jgi:hypothetical protein